MVSLPTYDDNAFARGISAKDYAKLLADPNKPLLNHAIAGALPAGIHVQARDGDRRARPTTRSRRAPGSRRGRTCSSARRGSGSGTTAAGARCTINVRLRPLERHVLLPARGHARHRPARPLGEAVRLRRADRHRPARRGVRDRPDRTRGSRRCSASKIYPGRGLPGRDRPGLRRRHADPADQRLRGPGERRQALPAAGRPRRHRARRVRRPAVRAEADPQARRPAERS